MEQAPSPTSKPASRDVRGLFPIGRFWTGKKGLVFFLVLLVCTIFILRKASSATWHEDGGKIFGTGFVVKYLHPQSLEKEVLAVLDSVDASMSLFNARSTLSLINANASSTADPLLLEVLQLSQAVSNETDGAFDVTVAPLVNLWGFGTPHRQTVRTEQVDSLLPYIGWQKIRLEGVLVRKSDPRIMIDCGAVAKGYAVDRVAELLQANGVKDYLVEIGGEIRVSGRNPQSRTWSVGLQKPIDDASANVPNLQAVLPLSSGAVATSGNYRNYYERDGHKFAHTIDPRKGYPVRHTLLSATVLAPNCATADAYATAFMVLGPEKSKAVLSRHKELQACFIYEEGGYFRTWSSPGLKLQE